MIGTGTRTWHEPSFAGRFGVARRDITPPPGIYSRSWGAAERDVADGVHRPLTCTVLTVRCREGVGGPLVLAAIDAGWFRGPEGAEYLIERACDGLSLGRSEVMLALSHTHSGPSISPAEREKTGGHLIESYLESIGRAIVEAGREALASERPGTLTFATARCGIAAERDLCDPGNADRYVCGLNPDGQADDTCLVGRVCSGDNGRVMATLVNYACHPTTLGAGNRLISPDYVGAMREVVESFCGGAPCLFVQGASGELAPREQYVSDTTVADGLGRALGHAAVSALAGMLAPGKRLEFAGVVESGAPLAVWRAGDHQASTEMSARLVVADIPLKETLRRPEQIAAELAACTDRALRERLHREALVVRTVGSGPSSRRGVWIWRLGEVVLLGHSDEAYSLLQTSLRAAFPDRAVVVMNVVNGWGGYLCPEHFYDRRQYQVQQSPYARGCLEMLIRESTRAVREMISEHRCCVGGGACAGSGSDAGAKKERHG